MDKYNLANRLVLDKGLLVEDGSTLLGEDGSRLLGVDGGMLLGDGGGGLSGASDDLGDEEVTADVLLVEGHHLGALVSGHHLLLADEDKAAAALAVGAVFLALAVEVKQLTLGGGGGQVLEGLRVVPSEAAGAETPRVAAPAAEMAEVGTEEAGAEEAGAEEAVVMEATVPIIGGHILRKAFGGGGVIGGVIGHDIGGGVIGDDICGVRVIFSGKDTGGFRDQGRSRRRVRQRRDVAVARPLLFGDDHGDNRQQESADSQLHCRS